MDISTISPPTKPPRGIKSSKETSGLLISVIRALSASETNEQREVEKAKLEKDYKRSDQRLEELVSIHEPDLLEVMKIFSELSERVTLAREKIHGVKENLNACKQLLNCRREELLKLWLEQVEHTHTLKLLNDIDEIREVPAKFSNYIDKKHYLHATKLLVSAFNKGEGVLENVEGLREVKAELELKKQKLCSRLLDELNKHLYKEYQRETGLKRQGSFRDFQRGSEVRSSKNPKVKRNLLDVSAPAYFSGQISRKTSSVGLEDLNNIIEDENDLNPEENSEHFLAIIIECLSLLNQIPEAVEEVKKQMQNELVKIIENCTKTVHESVTKQHNISIKSQDYSIKLEDSPSASPILELLNFIFERFKQVTTTHTLVLNGFNQSTRRYDLKIPLYDINDVWSCMQAVLQLLLAEYLDIQNVVDKSYQSKVALNEPSVDINMFFGKKRPPRYIKGLLFKFEFSTHSMSLNNYLKDHKYSSLSLNDSKNSKSKQLVCKADPKNITIIFRPIMHFIEDVERILEIPTGSPSCTLSNYLADYVKEVYLGRHHVLVATAIEEANRAVDAWRATTSPEVMRELALSRPLLKSTIKVQQCIAELRELMVALPLQGEHFCTLTLNVLNNYRETCHNAYRGIVQPDRHDRSICSAAWVKDEEIGKLMKSLSHWDNKRSNVKAHRKGFSGRRLTPRQDPHEEESQEDVKVRNLKEAELISRKLGENGIASSEILSDKEQLKSLALLQESIEWFSLSIKSLIRELRQSVNEKNFEMNVLPAMPEPLIESMEQVAKDFDDLSNSCMLTLHLEVRAQCFYYLHPRGDIKHLNKRDLEGSDPRVEELSRALQHIDEALQSTLHSKKTKFIFNGLGHLISKILISAAQYINKISEGGIQRMCRNVFTLQQTLTNITMTRELALDHARQYFELFYESPEGILDSIMELGPHFSELEYINALQLIARSRQEYASVNMHIEKLSEILNVTGITV